MLENIIVIVRSALLVCWWVVPVILLTWFAIWLRDRAEARQQDEWPYNYEPPFNMDQDSP